MEKVDIRIKKTNSQLISGFLELLKEKSFDNISVSEICNKAGVHRATFYKHFNDKFEFLTFCLESLLGDIDLSRLTMNPSPENIKLSCQAFIETIFEYINKYKYIFYTVFSGNQSSTFNYHLQSMITDFCFEKFSTVLIRSPEYKVRLLSEFYSGAVLGVVKWYVTQDSECTLDDIYTFFEHRIDEIIVYYREHLMDIN